MREPFVPPPYPYDRLDELKEIAAGRPGGLVDLSIGTPCDPPPAAVLEALRALRLRAWLPALDRYGELPGGRGGVDGAPPRGDHRRRPRGGVRRDEGAGGGDPAVAAPPATRPRHRPVPGDQLPHLRDGGDPCRLSSRALRRPRRHRPGRRGARALPLGERARQPDRRAPRPGGGRGVGASPRRAGPGGRVLHRVHLGRAAAHDPRARRGRGAGGALAVEAVEPRRRAGRLLRRGSGAGPLPVRGAQARRLHGARSGPGRGGGRLGRRRARRAAAGPISQGGWR